MWYEDDASAAGKIDRLHEWWSHLVTHGPKFRPVGWGGSGSSDKPPTPKRWSGARCVGMVA